MENYTGKELEVTLPSGFAVTIREQNGNDDDILSNVANATTGVSFAKFLAEIIIKDHRTGHRINFEKILDWKVNDLYYLILASRVHSLGAEVEFRVLCSTPTCKRTTRFEEDLTHFLSDFSRTNPKEGEDGYFKYRAIPYPHGADVDVIKELSTGKKIKFNYLTVIGENEYLKSNAETLSTNKQLLVRNIALGTEGNQWIPLANFGIFSPREMMEIRTAVKNEDIEWEPIMECICPHCKLQQNISVVQQPDFFYPLGK